MQDASVAWQLQPSAVYTCRSSCTQTCQHARGSTFAHTRTFAQSVGSHSSDLKWSRADQMAAWIKPQLHRLLTWPSCEILSVWRDFYRESHRSSESDNVHNKCSWWAFQSFTVGKSMNTSDLCKMNRLLAKKTNGYHSRNVNHTRIIRFTSMSGSGVVTGTN